MKIFETDGKLKHCAVLVVFVFLLVGGCSLFDDNDKDRSHDGGKSEACQEAEKNYNACLAAGKSLNECGGLREVVADACGY